jgi:cytochrome c biogenesis protein CcmG, thiol:disulfide interchange protein DsbE
VKNASLRMICSRTEVTADQKSWTERCGCIAGVFLLILAPCSVFAAPYRDPLLHKPAPAFVRTDLENHRVSLAELRGHVVLLNFWATWCAPCQIEMPRFSTWQSKYRTDGLEIIGVSMDDDLAPVESLVRKGNVNYPIVMGDEKLGLLYGGVLGLPVTYLIDREGVVRARFKGESNLDTMETAIQSLLRGH